MNVQKLSLTSFEGKSSVRNSRYYNGKKDVPHYQHREYSPISADDIIKSSILGGILGVLFSKNNKSAVEFAFNALRGVGIALLGIVSVRCVTSFLNDNHHE